MRGYVNIPESIYCKPCKHCGSKPVIASFGVNGYAVKCPADESHYQTKPGLIDLEDWNIHNTKLYDTDYDQQITQKVKQPADALR